MKSTKMDKEGNTKETQGNTKPGPSIHISFAHFSAFINLEPQRTEITQLKLQAQSQS